MQEGTATFTAGDQTLEVKGGQERHGEPGAPITEAEFDVAAFRDSYCRITVVDAAGRRAWGNPIWLQSASC